MDKPRITLWGGYDKNQVDQQMMQWQQKWLRLTEQNQRLQQELAACREALTVQQKQQEEQAARLAQAEQKLTEASLYETEMQLVIDRLRRNAVSACSDNLSLEDDSASVISDETPIITASSEQPVQTALQIEEAVSVTNEEVAELCDDLQEQREALKDRVDKLQAMAIEIAAMQKQNQ